MDDGGRGPVIHATSPRPRGLRAEAAVLFAERRGRRPVARQARAVCRPGDGGGPVMLPDED